MTIDLKLSGLHCSSCETLIREALSGLAGVRGVSVDASTGECRVEADEGTSTTAIEAAIKDLGYGTVS